jgi:hypothetical protein
MHTLQSATFKGRELGKPRYGWNNIIVDIKNDRRM